MMMKNPVLLFFLIIAFGVQAQYSISGTFMPAKDYKWLIAYRLKPGTQNYIADTAVQNGEFSLNIPENSLPGTYRLVYAVPQEEFFIDVIFNGKENIEFSFNVTEGVSFITSEENKLFNSYFKNINDLEKQFARYYTDQKTEVNEYRSIARQMKYIQKTYEDKTRGMMVHDFIKANHPYIPLDYESVFQYINNKKEAYFENLEFNNSILQASGFLTDKLANYVFTAIPLDATTKNEAENAQIENVDTVSARILDLDAKYKVHLYYTLWAQAAASGHDHTSDYIYDSYLKKLLSIGENQEIGQQIEEHNRLRLGATAPNIEWDEDEIRSDLRNIDGADKYLLVFWSSTCSHCLRELPALHKELKNNENVQVIAIGLEDDSYSWEDESSRMPDFIHVIALGKWESEYAELYAIDQTPTYFILDKDKKIRAKPEDDKAVVELLENY